MTTAASAIAVSALALKAAKIAGIVVLVLVLALVGFLLWGAAGDDGAVGRSDAPIRTFPGDTGEGGTGDGATSPERTPARVTVLCWNMAYGRGPVDDIGDRRDRDTIIANLEGIAAAIRASGADVVALQEVDFDARRTHGVDQVAFLMERLGWRYAAPVTTWRNNYVPFPYWPPSQHIGPIHSGQAVLSRYPITRNVRVRYPQPASYPFWYRAFYLNRATNVVDVSLGERRLVLLNTHLEAFDQPNRERQAELLVEAGRREADTAKAAAAFLVLGDFNAPPPEASRKTGFVDEPEMDFTADRTIATIREGLGPALGRPDGLSEVVARSRAEGADEAATLTFPWEEPTRQLDHVFFGAGLELVEGGVWRPEGDLSDHLPIRAVFALASE